MQPRPSDKSNTAPADPFDISTHAAYWVSAVISLLPWLATFPTAASRYLGSPACDMNNQFRHFIGFATSSLWVGQVPQWNPWIFCGTPFLPNTQATFWYPPNWLFLAFLPQPLSINLCIYLHVVMLALFMVYYARNRRLSNIASTFAASVVTLGSLMVCRIYAGHFTIICTVTWIPLVFAMQEKLFERARRFLLPFALSMTLMFLGGHAQYVFYAGLLLGVNLLVRTFRVPGSERAKWFLQQARWHIAASAVVIALTAIELFPLLDAVLNSARSNGPSLAWKRYFSMPPESYSTVLAPTLFGSGVNYFGRSLWWESCFYIGSIPFVFALSIIVGQIRGRKLDPITILLFLCFVLAGAGYFNIPSTLTGLIPGWNSFRGHSKILGFGMIFAAILAAKELDDILWENKKRATVKTIFLIQLLCAIALATWFNFGSHDRWKDILSSPTIASENYMHFDLSDPKTYAAARTEQLSAWKLMALWSFVGLVWLWSLSLPNIRKSRVVAFLALIVLADLLLFSLPITLQTFPKSESKIPPDIARLFAELSPQGRVAIPGHDIMNETMSIPARSFTGHDINVSKYFDTYLRAYQGKPDSGPNLHADINHESPLLDAANLKYVVTGTNIAPDMAAQLKEMKRIGPACVWERTNAMPRAFVVGVPKSIPSGEKEIISALTSGWDMKREVLLDGYQSPPTTKQHIFDAEPAEVHDINAAEVRVNVPRFDGWLVLTDGYYPWWTAIVAGKETPIYPANGTFRAVQVKAGDEVIFVYKNIPFLIGAFISAVAIISLAGLAILRRKPALKM